MIWTLTLRQQPDVPLELDGVTPVVLATLTEREVARLPVFHGNRAEELGSFFAVSGAAGGTELRVAGDCSRVKLLGAGLTTGRVIVDGSVGMHAGARMTGGTLEILGDAGDWLGAEMRGGTVRVAGNVSHQCGAAYRGSRHGMCGGEIVVRGDCGDEVGLLMRRGLIAVTGRLGHFAGAAMIAGTLVGFGEFGANCGAGMKRGTVLCLGPEPHLPPGFGDGGESRPAYLGVLFRHLRQLGSTPPVTTPTVRVRRGDLLHGGHGEVLTALG